MLEQISRKKMKYVPVIYNGKPLMPTKLSRAKRWIAVGKATPFYNKLGIFCVRLNKNPSDTKIQSIVLGIDPGSKREAFTVKTENKDLLNILTDAVTYVKENKEMQRVMRKSRRQRNTPCRKNRSNRSSLSQTGRIPPSTKTRWQHKINIVKQLVKVYPICAIVIEDIKAWTKKNKKNWNKNFSPLEVGKKWAYQQFRDITPLYLVEGTETVEVRKQLGLTKIKNKLSEEFEAHCVDSWVLCYWYLGGSIMPTNRDMLFLSRIRLHKRQLHALQPDTEGVRRNYGGTMSQGFKRGSIVKHNKHGKVYVGGTMKNRVSVHDLETGKRLAQNIKPEDCKFVGYNSYKSKIIRGVSNSS